ncbi:MAG: STAS domain-containing protein [Pseudomonadota bacterium]
MDIIKNLEKGTFNAIFTGKFTFMDNPAFRSVLDSMLDKEVNQLVIEMKGVEFVDSAALGMLLLARDEAMKNNKKLIIKGINGQVKKMFELAHFEQFFNLA